MRKRKEKERKQRDPRGAREHHALLAGAENRPNICGREVKRSGTRWQEISEHQDTVKLLKEIGWETDCAHLNQETAASQNKDRAHQTPFLPPFQPIGVDLVLKCLTEPSHIVMQ